MSPQENVTSLAVYRAYKRPKEPPAHVLQTEARAHAPFVLMKGSKLIHRVEKVMVTWHMARWWRAIRAGRTFRPFFEIVAVCKPYREMRGGMLFPEGRLEEVLETGGRPCWSCEDRLSVRERMKHYQA